MSRIIQGDAIQVLRTLADESMHCVVTSPPYWNLRDYGIESQVWGGDDGCAHEWGAAGSRPLRPDRCSDSKDTNGGAVFTDRLPRGAQAAKSVCGAGIQYGAFCHHCGAWRGSLGLEPTPELYVEHMVMVFREVRRVLRRDGTLWLNLGDSYAGSGKAGNNPEYWGKHKEFGKLTGANPERFGPAMFKPPPGLKPKDLVGIPWRVAFALQADGWYLRSDIIWSKPNPMPESVTDRPTRAHEYVFLLSRSRHYFHDAEAVKEASSTIRPELLEFGPRQDVGYTGHMQDRRRRKVPAGWDVGDGHHGTIHRDGRNGRIHGNLPGRSDGGAACNRPDQLCRNARTVWTIATQPFAEAHFATFPEELARRCIEAGCPARVCPECGAPCKRVVERKQAARAPSNGKHGSHSDPHHSARRMIEATAGARAAGGDHDNPFPLPVTLGFCPTCEHCREPTPGIVLDPFGGSGTVGLVAQKLGREYLLIELKPEYVEMAKRRIREAMPLFAE